MSFSGQYNMTFSLRPVVAECTWMVCLSVSPWHPHYLSSKHVWTPTCMHLPSHEFCTVSVQWLVTSVLQSFVSLSLSINFKPYICYNITCIMQALLCNMLSIALLPLLTTHNTQQCSIFNNSPNSTVVSYLQIDYITRCWWLLYACWFMCDNVTLLQFTFKEPLQTITQPLN